MAHTITLFEHEAAPYTWDDRQLSLIEQLRSATGNDVLRATTRRGQRMLQAGHYVGVVRLGNQTVQILPKIYQDSAAADERARVRAATQNLLHLLAYAGELEIRETAIAALLRRESNWFEILTHLFATHLIAEWQRGPARSYETVTDELPLLKGRWLIAQQLRRPERRHIFSVAYDEFTADTWLNRVLRFVVERLWQLTRDAENRRLLGDLRQWLDEVTLLPSVRAVEADPARLTRLNRRYLPLLHLARLFLDGGALQLASGDVASFAFVFDMNQLFERFVVRFIGRHRATILPIALADADLLPQTRGATAYLAQSAARRVFRLEPDLAVRQGGRFPLLLDTKYKRLDPRTAAGGISQVDFYQMHAYAARYDCPRVVLLYPQTAGSATVGLQTFTLEHAPATQILAATVDLREDLGRPAAHARLVTQLQHIMIGASS